MKSLRSFRALTARKAILPSSRAARHTRPLLAFDELERRELMAADTAAALLPVSSGTTQTAQVGPALSTARGSTLSPTAALLQAAARAVAAGVRSLDGTGNNLKNTALGSVGQQLLRVADADYGDGISTPAGANRPSARVISNALVAQTENTTSSSQLSAFIYAWGQFIDHDMDLTEPPANAADREAFNVDVPAGDPQFDPDGNGSPDITLNRSRFDSATGEDTPREQINQITAWIDGSMVYGSDKATAASLRAFSGGRLLTSPGKLPPTDANGNFLAGDTRANENIELTSMHTLFIREHNYCAGKIAQQNPGLSDEAIYQQARAIVIAEIQSITYNEFLPALLGRRLTAYRGYNSTVDPSIANEFSTAAFRLHTLINDDVEFFGNNGRAVRDEVTLAEAFNNPDLLRETGADNILKYLASTQAQEFDNHIVDSLRNFLFGAPGQGGLDLASLNIQRGRDHGLDDYNDVREAYGLPRARSFADISSNREVQRTLQQLYGSVNNIDLWVGALAEDHAPGAPVGELVQKIVADQFQRLRDGDRFWYQKTFSGAALQQIESTSLSDIISRNTTISNLQGNVFVMAASVSGEIYNDANGNGRRDFRETSMRGVKLELLDDEGAVIATTTTNDRGRYQFDAFHETGDFRVRLVVPSGYVATRPATVDVLVSRGDVSLRNMDFALKAAPRPGSQAQSLATPTDATARLTDAVFAEAGATDSELGSIKRRSRR